MAGIGVSPIVLLSLLLLAIGGAHATFFPTTRVVTVTGQVCCTQNGNCPGTPVVGAVVSLTCLGTILNPGVVVATTTTSATGTYSFAVTTTTNSIFIFSNVIPCTVTVQLPLSAAICPVLSTTSGRLIGPIVPTIEAGGVLTGTVPTFILSNV